jgi:hypothetical protein
MRSGLPPLVKDASGNSGWKSLFASIFNGSASDKDSAMCAADRRLGEDSRRAIAKALSARRAGLLEKRDEVEDIEMIAPVAAAIMPALPPMH